MSETFKRPPRANPKSEYRNPKQIENPKSQTKKLALSSFCIWEFGFVSDFEFGFRI